MSKQMVQSFFPAMAEEAGKSAITNFLFHHVAFPDSTAQYCPEYKLSISTSTSTLSSSTSTTSSFYLRRPWLFLAALWGIYTGLYGTWKILRQTKSNKINIDSKNVNNNRQTQDQQQRHRQKVVWSISFLCFALMNVSAVFLHTIVPFDGYVDKERTTAILYPDVYPFLWVCDTYMTGVSASSISIAALDGLYMAYHSKNMFNNNSNNKSKENATGLLGLPPPPTRQYNFVVITFFLFMQGIGLCCIAWFYILTAIRTTRIQNGEKDGDIHNDYDYDNNKSLMLNYFLISANSSATAPLELWYLLPPIVAAIPFCLLIFGPPVKRSITILKQCQEQQQQQIQQNGHDTKQQSAEYKRHGNIITLLLEQFHELPWSNAHAKIVISFLLILVFGILMDPIWCMILHDNNNDPIFGDLMTASTLTFWGCDFAFWGTCEWLLTSSDSPLNFVLTDYDNDDDDEQQQTKAKGTKKIE